MRAILISVAAAMILLAAGCDNLTDSRGGTLLENWRFTPEFREDPIAGHVAEMSPWKFNQATCRIAGKEGGDGEKGYIALQYAPSVAPTGDTLLMLVGVARQELSVPIRIGRTYTISISGSLSATLPDQGKVASSRASIPVRFYAYNGTLEEYPYAWTEARGRLVPMGGINVTGKKWENYSAIRWVADANYTGFAVCIGDVGRAWTPDKWESDMVFLDNVILQEQD